MSRLVGGLLAFAIGMSLVEAEIRAQDLPSAPSEQTRRS
jgi:hypothetical protein